MRTLKVLFLISFWSTFICRIGAQVELSENTEVSILTIGPGAVLEDGFGHSALRIKDPSNKLDLVFDYGRYDFEADGFYLNFAKGRLTYEIGWTDFKRFISTYKQQKRRVFAQTINLSHLEKKQLFKSLLQNIQPQNKSYSYDFFYNNCATKIIDIIDEVTQDTVIFLAGEPYTTMTFRDMIHSHIPENSWGGFGIDIALGSEIDRETSLKEQLFLPKNMSEILNNSRYEKRAEKLILKTEVLSVDQNPYVVAFWISPLITIGLVSILILFITYRDWRKKIRNRLLDSFIFLLTGLFGILVLFLWFGTEHTATSFNYNFLWAFAFNLFFIPTVLKTEVKKRFMAYLKFLVLMLFLMLLHWFTGVQSFNFVLIPLWISLTIRYIYVLQWSKQNLKIQS